jgi:glycosyltransferase involved in cell wall biosynthesis
MPKRILICATQVPFVRGGAELLVDGLRDALRERGHTVDVVALPFQWHPPERIAESALAWRMLDISQVNGQPVDLVIATKFPSYLVRHPQKVLWLVHQHRQAYDWYGTPMSDLHGTPAHRTIREQIFRMDERGIGECRERYTISANVSGRLQRFNGISSTPLYPPSRYASQIYAGPYTDYILAPARLDRAKRLDLFVQALAQTRTPVRAMIAGSGPDHERLATMISQFGLQDRVRLLGFVPDADLIELYARARAVYYAPLDEDYGFATVEAFGAARPVITTDDSGGVLEFVRHNENGLVSPADPAAIAQHLDAISDNSTLAEQLGCAGQPLVAPITWERVCSALMGG